MRSKPTRENYVTEPVFKREINSLHQKIDGVEARLDQKIDNVALTVIKIDERLGRVEHTIETKMATKDDINLILNRLDHVFKKVSIFDQEEGVQSLALVEVKQRVDDHEKRLTTLESPR